ncbi:uncharacterized protein K452DRAFT_217512 [Aplosporella prunicola CBS 121167]|uniref:Kinetochore protein mis14 n=1 Tax=Aplosporella prunicola CBS 121167 TaxID=1176127 RepID=A0A6A6BT31_9PEZI|nr:uncharacterized protein K452DRAFT_217512 [Aplosporella prunicola CBS 121167]KAF2147282.1 hypothetical protein K452DRAFT_217512 [Aplosporella prunicola CBS 121167]
MDAAHRRIELQAPADLAYLVANAKRAARQKIDLHLPPSAAPEGGEDVLRRRVEELVDEYIKATFASARHNIEINGMPPQELLGEEELQASAEANPPALPRAPEYEPIDSRLADRIRALEAQKELLTGKVADLRRTAPARAAAAQQAAMEAEREALELAFAQRDAVVAAVASGATATATTEGAAVGLGDVPAFARWDDVLAMWERGASGLVELKGGLTGTVAKLERAERACAVLEGGTGAGGKGEGEVR